MNPFNLVIFITEDTVSHCSFSAVIIEIKTWTANGPRVTSAVYIPVYIQKYIQKYSVTLRWLFYCWPTVGATLFSCIVPVGLVPQSWMTLNLTLLFFPAVTVSTVQSPSQQLPNWATVKGLSAPLSIAEWLCKPTQKASFMSSSRRLYERSGSYEVSGVWGVV